MKLPRKGLSIVLALSLLVLVLHAGTRPVRGDIVKLRTGEVYEGEATMGGGAYCEVRLRDGSVVRIPRGEIESIEEGSCSWEAYDGQEAACDFSDADEIMALVESARECGMWREWRENLEKVIEIKPNHKTARMYLGQEKTDEGWVDVDFSGGEWSPVEYVRAGFKYNLKKRKWLSPDDVNRAARRVLFRGEWKEPGEVKAVLKKEELAERSIIGGYSEPDLIEKVTAFDASVFAGNSAGDNYDFARLAVKAYPKNPLSYCGYAIVAFTEFGDFPAALAALKSAKKSGLALRIEAAIELAQGNFAKSESIARKAAGSESSPGLIQVGRALYYQRKYEDAVKTLKRLHSVWVGPGYNPEGIYVTQAETMGYFGNLYASLVLLDRKDEAEELYKAYVSIGSVSDPEYEFRKRVLRYNKTDLLGELKNRLFMRETIEERDRERRLLANDGIFDKCRDLPEFGALLAAEGADTTGWTFKTVPSEGSEEKSIRKAAKKKQAFDLSGGKYPWGVIATGRYLLFTNARRPVPVEIGNRLEKLGAALDGVLKTGPKKGKEPILRIYRNRAGYTKYMMNYYRHPSKSAYYIPTSGEVVTYAPPPGEVDRVFADIIPACVAQRLYADFGSPLQVWLTEGIGAYFSTTKYDRSKFKFETGALNAAYLSIFKGSHPDPARAPDLAHFFNQTRLKLEKTGDSDRAGKADLWGFIYFLVKSPDEKVREILPRYLAALGGKKDRSEALDTVFTDIDRETLSRMMVEFINEQQIPVKKPKKKTGK